uniref:Uncharacterized protein n=1 Tax=Rhizophora mucronata TaxID=61149 RepID=A0A2P2NCN8_RHIMU
MLCLANNGPSFASACYKILNQVKNNLSTFFLDIESPFAKTSEIAVDLFPSFLGQAFCSCISLNL